MKKVLSLFLTILIINFGSVFAADVWNNNSKSYCSAEVKALSCGWPNCSCRVDYDSPTGYCLNSSGQAAVCGESGYTTATYFVKYSPLVIVKDTNYTGTYNYNEWICVQNNRTNVKKDDVIEPETNYNLNIFSFIYEADAPDNCIGKVKTKISKSIKLDVYNEDATISEKSLTYNLDNTLTLPTPSLYNYIFLGWTGSNGSTPQTEVIISKDTVGESLSYTANWAALYTLTINPDGGTYNNTTSNTTVKQVQNTIYSISEPTKTGYVFKGWTLTGGGSYSDGEYIFGTSNGTLTAEWEAEWIGPYSDSKSDTTFVYKATKSVSWSFDSPGVKLAYVSCEGSNKNSEQNQTRIKITTSDGKYSNTLVADSGVSDFTAWTSFKEEVENVTYVYCENASTVNVKNLYSSIKYYKKGS